MFSRNHNPIPPPFVKMPLQWGLIGPGAIAAQIAPHVFYPASPNALHAVASRDLKRATEFAAKFGTRNTKSYGSYQELISDKEVGAVYIATPTTGRVELCLACAAAGKHVIAEKPIALTSNKVEFLINEFRARNLVFLDATHFVHHPRTQSLLSTLQSISPITSIDASFHVPLPRTPSQIRFMTHVEPLGALGDLGWYPLRLILLCFGNEQPVKVSAVTHGTSDAIIGMSGTLFFPDLEDGKSRIARFSCGFEGPFSQSARISSATTTITLEDFVHPWSYLTGKPGNPRFTIHRGPKTEVVESEDRVAVDLLFRRFQRLVNKKAVRDDEIDSYREFDRFEFLLIRCLTFLFIPAIKSVRIS